MFLYSNSNLTKICSLMCNWQCPDNLFSFGLGKCSSPDRKQSITRTVDDPVHEYIWCMTSQQVGNDLTETQLTCEIITQMQMSPSNLLVCLKYNGKWISPYLPLRSYWGCWRRSKWQPSVNHVTKRQSSSPPLVLMSANTDTPCH